MEIGKRYVVTKPSKDKTFCVGDHIKLNADGSINCLEAEGWIDADDVAGGTVGMQVELDTEWVERRKKALRGELELLTGVGE